MIEYRIYAGTYNNLYVSMFEHESVRLMRGWVRCCCCWCWRFFSSSHSIETAHPVRNRMWNGKTHGIQSDEQSDNASNKESKLNKTNNPRNELWADKSLCKAQYSDSRLIYRLRIGEISSLFGNERLCYFRRVGEKQEIEIFFLFQVERQ